MMQGHKPVMACKDPGDGRRSLRPVENSEGVGLEAALNTVESRTARLRGTGAFCHVGCLSDFNSVTVLPSSLSAHRCTRLNPPLGTIGAHLSTVAFHWQVRLDPVPPPPIGRCRTATFRRFPWLQPPAAAVA